MDRQALEKKINDLSMLLVMSDGSDPIVAEVTDELCQSIAAESASDSSLARLASASLEMCRQRAQLSAEAFYELAQHYVSSAQSFLSGAPSARFASEKAEAQQVSEFADYFDASFAVEFIEKHTMALEEMEAAVVEARFRTEDDDSEQYVFNKFLKGYLHTLKGDAGAIGWVGIENSTHAIEDLINEHGPQNLYNVLLSFRGWLLQCFQSYAAGTDIVVPHTMFLQGAMSLIEMERMLGGGQPSSGADSTACPDDAEAPETGLASAAAVGTVVHMSMDDLDFSDFPAEKKQTGGEYNLVPEAELLSEFIAEAEDHLNAVESILLEAGAEFPMAEVGTIFRAVHSLKGASAYFNLLEINETSHSLENILDEVRSGKREPVSTLVPLTLRYIDLQKQYMTSARKAMSGNGNVSRSPETKEFLDALVIFSKTNSCGAIAAASAPEVAAPNATAAPSPSAVMTNPERQIEDLVKPAHVVRSEATVVASTVAPGGPPAAKSGGRPGEKTHIKSFVKIDTVRLDGLIDSIGEMVIYSSMLIRTCQQVLGSNEAVAKIAHQVEKSSRELQDIGMSMRLDPIKGLFQKMSRLVWDTSKKIGKEINFHLKGEETELDRTVIESLADPLMHMVRNAIDHGVEMPDERVVAGKPRTGNISLSAFHSGGSINIVIEDDGRGLDPEKLRKKAIEKGIIPENHKLSEQEAFQLIFAAGFSTAAAVTDLSGRGVGMDVVRNNIESMRGHVTIESVVGKGTRFIIDLPLTLAIIDGIECVVGVRRFLIPTLSVLEFVRPQPNMLSTTIGNGESLFFRSVHIPLFRLNRLFVIEDGREQPEDGIVVVVENGHERVAFLVDDLVASCQTVIKSLGPMFRDNRGLAGCAIMPNGDIGLIIDVRSLLQLARSEDSVKLPRTMGLSLNELGAPQSGKSGVTLELH